YARAPSCSSSGSTASARPRPSRSPGLRTPCSWSKDFSVGSSMRSAAREIPQHVSPGSRRRLRVLLLAPHPFFQHRGTPIAERALLEVLSAQGHSVDVVTFPEGEAVDVPGCRIYRTP